MIGIFKKKCNSARPLINVLIRTSNRSNYFSTCYESISGQTYNNIRIIVSWDNEETKNYLKSYRNIRKTKVSLPDQHSYPQPDVPRGKKIAKFPPNLYLNKLMQQVKEGFVVFLDDDDVFTSPTSLETIANHISSENDLLFWRVQFPEGRLIPEDEYFGKPPEFWHISGIGFAFHSKYIPFAQWDGWKGGDFAVTTKLYGVIPNKVFIDQPLTGLQRQEGWGGFGKGRDKKES